MAFGIYVYDREKLAAAGDFPGVQDDALLERWLAAAHSACLYSNPLGNNITVAEWWSALASDLSLPFLSRVSESGLDIDDEVELDRLRDEVAALRAAWARLDIDEGVRAHLEERAGYVLEGIQVAKDSAGLLTIG